MYAQATGCPKKATPDQACICAIFLSSLILLDLPLDVCSTPLPFPLDALYNIVPGAPLKRNRKVQFFVFIYPGLIGIIEQDCLDDIVFISITEPFMIP